MYPSLVGTKSLGLLLFFENKTRTILVLPMAVNSTGESRVAVYAEPLIFKDMSDLYGSSICRTETS